MTKTLKQKAKERRVDSKHTGIARRFAVGRGRCAGVGDESRMEVLSRNDQRGKVGSRIVRHGYVRIEFGRGESKELLLLRRLV